MNYTKLLNSMPAFVHDTPAFVERLKQYTPFSSNSTKRQASDNETDVTAGLFPVFTFPDPEGLLSSTLQDLTQFLKEAGYAGKCIPLSIRQSPDPMPEEEALITITGNSITIESDNTEGIRHGIYEIMDRLTASPFLKRGTTRKHFFIKNRISRCFFGPIKRPPYNVDELMNEVDYYPEPYLARLAREGVNGLWITAVFREICETTLLPVDQNRSRRIEKLRRTVERCRKYGIKVWLFFLEPIDISKDIANAAIRERLRGPMGSFCPKSEEAQTYLYECGYSLFRDVPHLGGIILMTLGERMTSCLNAIPHYHCYSKKSMLRDIPPANACGEHCPLTGADILAETVTPIRNGMKAAAPESELIVQFYNPGADKMHDEIFDIADGLPEDTALVLNYESSVTVRQLGKARSGADYWLSVPGPSDRFGRMAEKIRHRGEMGAKIQACCSHELATVPYIPVPAMLYRKYLQMRSLDIRHVLQCWYFGNYPGVMNHAAGMLSAEDFSDKETEFYTKLAGACNLRDPEHALQAWNCFAHAYSFYPLSAVFQYYGPAHHGIVWPLYLKQICRSLPQTWLPDPRPAGDAVCECLGAHSLTETAALCRKMSDEWDHGLRIFQKTGNPEEEILYSAIGVLFASCANILEFYELRRRLVEECTHGTEERFLSRMSQLVEEEINNCRKMIQYCEADSRLGYHSEAEIYKFFPEKIKWRKEALKHLLEEEIPDVRKEFQSGKSPWEVIVDTTNLHHTGEICHASAFSVKVENGAAYKLIHITLAEVNNCSKTFTINLSDPLCASLHYSANASIADGKVTLYDPCTAGEAQLSADGKELVIRYPAVLLPERFRLGIIYKTTHADGTVFTEGWPVKDTKPEGRLELYGFNPENLALFV